MKAQLDGKRGSAAVNEGTCRVPVTLVSVHAAVFETHDIVWTRELVFFPCASFAVNLQLTGTQLTIRPPTLPVQPEYVRDRQARLHIRVIVASLSMYTPFI